MQLTAATDDQRSTFANAFKVNVQQESLLGDLDNLSPEQLRERLIIAETLLKKLYERNKDVEMYHKNKTRQDSLQKSAQKLRQSQENSPKNDTILVEDNDEGGEVHEIDLITQFKQREERLQQELIDKQTEIDKLKSENLQLIKNGASFASKQTGMPQKEESVVQDPHFVNFLEERLQECQEENKRYLLKYQDLRNFTYS